MSTLVKGIHHITQCPGPAQQDVDFCTQVLGQRLVKQTVLLDGNIPIYHFYYGNADGEPGSITTSFPYSRKPGRVGSGQISLLSYAIPKGTVSFWKEHVERHGVDHADIQERFARKYLRINHPAGMQYEVVEADDCRRPWTTRQISADVATRGFFGAVMSVRSIEEQEQFFVDALGFRVVQQFGPAMAIVENDDLTLWLAGPGASGLRYRATRFDVGGSRSSSRPGSGHDALLDRPPPRRPRLRREARGDADSGTSPRRREPGSCGAVVARPRARFMRAWGGGMAGLRRLARSFVGIESA